MTTTTRTTAVGIFTERRLADHAIEELHNAGFSNDQIGFVSREGYTGDKQELIIPAQAGTGTAPTGGAPVAGVPTPVSTDDVTATEESKTETTAAGVVGGGVLGGILGAAAALLIPGLGPAIAGGILTAVLGGAAIGAVAGGLIGALTNLGVPEDEAHFYQDELRAGRTLVTVQAKDRYEEALAILRRNGAYDATTRRDTTDTTATTVDDNYTSAEQPADSYPSVTHEQPATYTPEETTEPVQRPVDNEIREPEVPSQPDRVQRFTTNTPPPTYNQRP
ncbi:hypothetical protein KSF_008480 [Reticulibacter mediterranei]|uniref:General stress protein 17M-like domain-containing protein n=1 Tax=Reticulibacter mediterranei TaxID=2778369 RepID=A0A8J3IE48_9CHLR|nr:general stress protein [Reticulibacter mediterranei]GHO90800.1 hypothetical protein KSF_008480 [Reticulibacter mediterranei]